MATQITQYSQSRVIVPDCQVVLGIRKFFRYLFAQLHGKYLSVRRVSDDQELWQFPLEIPQEQPGNLVRLHGFGNIG